MLGLYIGNPGIIRPFTVFYIPDIYLQVHVLNFLLQLR